MYEALQPKLTREIIYKPQTAKNIALQLRRAIRESKPAANVIKYKFRGKSRYTTCFNVYNYLRRRLKYVAEPASLQSAKTIPRILYDGKGDCKHYTVFACSVLSSLGIPCQMRLISQSLFKPEPTHIYCVAYNKDGSEIIVDPCISTFNREARRFYKYNLNI